MTDLEITKLCAEAMGIVLSSEPNILGRMTYESGTWEDASHQVHPVYGSYNPLEDDAQAMALVKKFRLWIGGWLEGGIASVSKDGKYLTSAEDLNRAICECVAKMQAAKDPDSPTPRSTPRASSGQ